LFVIILHSAAGGHGIIDNTTVFPSAAASAQMKTQRPQESDKTRSPEINSHTAKSQPPRSPKKLHSPPTPHGHYVRRAIRPFHSHFSLIIFLFIGNSTLRNALLPTSSKAFVSWIPVLSFTLFETRNAWGCFHLFFADAAMRFVSIGLASTTHIDSFDLVAAEHSLAGSIPCHAVQVRVRATAYAEGQRTTDYLARRSNGKTHINGYM
jgi:hypothetical protein